jgi:hypothetical protein
VGLLAYLDAIGKRGGMPIPGVEFRSPSTKSVRAVWEISFLFYFWLAERRFSVSQIVQRRIM